MPATPPIAPPRLGRTLSDHRMAPTPVPDLQAMFGGAAGLNLWLEAEAAEHQPVELRSVVVNQPVVAYLELTRRRKSAPVNLAVSQPMYLRFVPTSVVCWVQATASPPM